MTFCYVFINSEGFFIELFRSLFLRHCEGNEPHYFTLHVADWSPFFKPPLMVPRKTLSHRWMTAPCGSTDRRTGWQTERHRERCRKAERQATRRAEGQTIYKTDLGDCSAVKPTSTLGWMACYTSWHTVISPHPGITGLFRTEEPLKEGNES